MEKVKSTVTYELTKGDLKDAVMNYFESRNVSTQYKNIVIEPKFVREEIYMGHTYDNCEYNEVFDGLKIVMTGDINDT